MKLFDKKSKKIEKEDLKDAKLSSLDFQTDSIKKRAFMDVLGARLAIKMLFAQKVQVSNVYSLYTINNILKDLDIADVYFNDVKIDVRLVFDRDKIFIPKSHFEYGLLPDIYLVLEVNEDFSNVQMLGYFEPDELDKENQNDEYYFYPYENLHETKSFKSFLKKYNARELSQPTEEELDKAEELFLPLIDGDISLEDRKFLYEKLANNIDLREKIVEFENFELISSEINKSGDLIHDGVLDIVGAQQIYDEEDEINEKAEVHDEVLTDLIVDGLGEKEKVAEDIEENPTFENELKDAVEEKNKDKDNSLIKGIAIGGAIAGAVAGTAAAASAATTAGAAGAASLANSQGGLIDAAANVAAKGVEAAGDLISSIPANTPSSDASNGSFEDILKDSGNVDNPDGELDFDDLFSDLDDENLEESLPETDLETENATEDIKIEEEPEQPIIENEDTVSEDNEFEIDDIISDSGGETFEESLSDIEVESESEIEDLKLEEDTASQDLELETQTEDEENGIDLENLAQDNLDVKLEGPPLESESEIEEDKLIDENIEDTDNLVLESFEDDKEQNEDLFILPEINLGEEEEPDITSIAEVISEEKPITVEDESKEDVVSLDDFNFDLLKQNNDFDDETYPEIDTEEISTPSYLAMATDANLQTENKDENIISKNELTEEEIAEAAKELASQETDTNEKPEENFINNSSPNNDKDFSFDDDEDFGSDDDAFISDAEKAFGSADLSDDQRSLLEDALKMYDDEENSETISANAGDEDLVGGLFNEDALSAQAENLEGLQTEADGSEKPEEDEDLDMLFAKKRSSGFSMDNIGGLITKNKKLVVVAAVAGALVISGVVGSVMKQPSPDGAGKPATPPAENAAPNTSGQPSTESGANATAPDTQDANSAIGPDIGNSPAGTPQAGKSQNREVGQAMSDAFLSEPVSANISKVAWEVPEDLAYNDSFRRYLQVTGKNLKLNLQNDLLLATEMAYSNHVIVDLKIGSDGSLQSENVAASSGSKQIDKIVLQSVKETLTYLKMPASQLKGGSANITLIINF